MKGKSVNLVTGANQGIGGEAVSSTRLASRSV